jgi:hypothetical protein
MGSDSFVQLPTDSTGKKSDALQMIIAGNTVQRSRVVVASGRVRSGVHIVAFQGTVAAAIQNGTSTGFWWLYNPVGSAFSVALRRVMFQSQFSTALLTSTAPRIQLSRFTFTGTPSGTAVPIAKQRTADTTFGGFLTSTQATSVVTLGNPIFAFLPVWTQSTTSGGPNTPSWSDWNPDEDGMPILAAGEGIVCWQADAGTASDTRKFVTNFAFEQFTEP